jgi:transposase
MIMESFMQKTLIIHFLFYTIRSILITVPIFAFTLFSYLSSSSSALFNFVMRPLPKAIVDNAIVMLRNGNSARATAKALGISISSAVRIQRQQKENIPPLKKGGPMKVSERTRETMARLKREGILRSIHDAQKYIESVEGCRVHGETVRRYLRQEGLNAYVQPRKPDLTKDQMKERRKFAKEHMHWTIDDWLRVMFSDETLICRVGHYGRR